MIQGKGEFVAAGVTLLAERLSNGGIVQTIRKRAFPELVGIILEPTRLAFRQPDTQCQGSVGFVSLAVISAVNRSIHTSQVSTGCRARTLRKCRAVVVNFTQTGLSSCHCAMNQLASPRPWTSALRKRASGNTVGVQRSHQ
ncbi:hypothetical protein RJ55_08163 [Drechmeria coniospora]|nr:hypothetical protein RJ55_08163 [Drechmeria coniospora]